MKKIYQKPSIKIKEIETESMMAGSENLAKTNGDTGITIGEGEPPTSGSAKGNGFFDSEDESSISSNIWN